MQTDRYISPLSTRYASAEMQYLFSQDFKFRTWRRLWIALARAEKTLGLAITDEQIAELEAHRDDINYAEAEAREREVRHDVMSHVYAYGLQCPKAAGIIHLGATSCYVGDNTDLIILREAAQLVVKKAVQVVHSVARATRAHSTRRQLGDVGEVRRYRKRRKEREIGPRKSARLRQVPGIAPPFTQAYFGTRRGENKGQGQVPVGAAASRIPVVASATTESKSSRP